MFRSSKPSAANKAARTESDEQYHAIFARFAEADNPEVMTMEGIATFCEELGIDAGTDVKALSLIWRLGGVSRPGCISKTEFTAGMKQMGARSMADLKAKVPSVDPGFLETKEFRDFYKFVFQFNREGTQKTIEKDVIVALLPLVLDLHKAPHMTHMLRFLEEGLPANTRITLDQWDSILLFNQSVQVDLSGYDENSAWPILLDDYVEWRNKQ